MSWDVRQTRRFARTYKKLHDNVVTEVDAAVEVVARDPDIGEKKKGDLSDLWVYKFRCLDQLYLLGYTRDDGVRLVYLEGKTAVPTLQGDVLTLQAEREGGERKRDGSRTFVLEVASEAASSTLLASLPILDRLLSEKIIAVRKRHMEEMVDFMAAHMVAPTQAETGMAQRLATRHARVLNEFGYFTAEALADKKDKNNSRADNRAALTDNWRKRKQVFAVPHPDRTSPERDVFPAFQFEDGKPIKAVKAVLEAFGGRKAPWKLALWFTSNNGWLPDSARPVDLLTQNPQAVIAAAHREAEGSAA